MGTTERPADVRAALRHGSGAVGPREGAILLACALGVTREDLFTRYAAAPVPPPAWRQYGRMLRRRRRGEPLAYLTGRAAFWDMELEVTPAVLVPRPETEHLVEGVAAAARGRTGPVRVADIGTGSGAIALALARALPQADVCATDRSAAAVRVARRNAQRWAPGVRLLPAGDLLQPLVRAHVVVDFVVMNPPYVRTRELRRLPRDVRREPQAALDGGLDGLGIVRRLVRDLAATEVLGTDGEIWLEVGAGQAGAVRRILADRCHAVQVARDYAGIERVVWGRWHG